MSHERTEEWTEGRKEDKQEDMKEMSMMGLDRGQKKVQVFDL